MFLFEQMFNTALNGMVSTGLMDGILTVAYGILLASLLFSAYEVWTRGGDVRSLAIAGAKYMALGLLFLNGGAIYDSVFRSLVGAFNQIAHHLAGVGASGRIQNLAERNRECFRRFGHDAESGTGVPAGILSALFLLIAGILYPIAYTVFAILYSLFGTILYVAGPLVLSIMPSMGLGTVSTTVRCQSLHLRNLGTDLRHLLSARGRAEHSQYGRDYGAGSFAGAFSGASAEVLLSAASILFSVCIMLIPFLAKRIVEGDIGSAMLLVQLGFRAW